MSDRVHPRFALWLIRTLVAALIVLGIIVGVSLCVGCIFCGAYEKFRHARRILHSTAMQEHPRAGRSGPEPSSR
jgi:hypothetical protein